MPIGWEVGQNVVVATIDRPERRNALDADHCDELRTRLAASDEVRAVVITGAGSAFCAGADLGTRFHEGHDVTDDGDPFHEVLQDLLDAVVDHPAPVIAAVNGPALGAGTQLASVCDLRVASEGALFGIPAARLGIMISPGSVERILALIGPAHTSEMLLTARRYDAEEAHRIGLVHRVVPDARAGALEWAEEISALAPLSVQGHKRAIAAAIAARGLDDRARADVGRLVARAVTSEDLREGLAAFSEKRTPHFRGR